MSCGWRLVAEATLGGEFVDAVVAEHMGGELQRLEHRREGAVAILEVSDTGPGVPASGTK